jgi:hypothetical protein
MSSTNTGSVLLALTLTLIFSASCSNTSAIPTKDSCKLDYEPVRLTDKERACLRPSTQKSIDHNNAGYFCYLFPENVKCK